VPKPKFHQLSSRRRVLPPKLAQIDPSSFSGTYLMGSQKSVSSSRGASFRTDQSSLKRRKLYFGRSTGTGSGWSWPDAADTPIDAPQTPSTIGRHILTMFPSFLPVRTRG
jgi:hypothetical protein